MKRATVTCAMDYFAAGVLVPETTEGYACEVFGVPMVVHHLLRYEGGPHPRLWTVTEPTTGRLVSTARTRALAIECAEEAVFAEGGRDSLNRMIEKYGPIATPKPLQGGSDDE